VAARPGYLPTPYVVALLPWCALLIAAAVQRGLPWIRPALAEARSEATTVRAAAAVAVCAVLAAALTVGVTRRVQDVASLATQDATASSLAASRWMATHVDPRARVLADDTFFVDLARAGFEPGLGVVWFYKLDFVTNLDPSVVARLPAGYRSFDYVVSSPVLRAALDTSPGQLGQVRAALAASRPVASFGQGRDLVEVRRLVGPGTGSGRIPRDRG
jgi:hypothetical protein